MAEGDGQHGFEDHTHEAVVHSHRHFHVTHNATDGGFEHLSSAHEHEHDHPALQHAHIPHEDFESEHAGEAHTHDHGEPVKGDRDDASRKPAKKAAARKTPAKKAAPAADTSAT